MKTATLSSLSAEREAEAQVLAERIRELVNDELLEVARLLISKPDREIFGETERQVRDLLHKAGAKAFEEHLRQKKTATRDAASTVQSADKPPSFKGIAPSRP